MNKFLTKAKFLFTVFMMLVVLCDLGIAMADEFFQATMTGASEVPSVVTNTDGRLRVWVDADEAEIKLSIRVKQGMRVTQAHFHCAPEGSNGPVTAFLAGFHPRGWDVDGKWISNQILTSKNVMSVLTADCSIAEGSMSDLLAEMRAGDIYINVHTIANAPGEIRGQVK